MNANIGKAGYSDNDGSGMPTRNVVLTTHHEAVIDALVGSGSHQNASDASREGLRLIERREAREAAKLNALQQASAIGFDDLDAGRYRDVRSEDLAGFVAALGRRGWGGTGG